MRDERKFCFTCDEYVEPDYVCKPVMAQYGTIVVGKGLCPHCGRVIVAEAIIEDDGLIPPKRDSRYGR